MTFTKGKSGNPSGRPKGAQDRRTLFRSMIEPQSAELVSKAISMALNGNEQMLKLLLERILPAKPGWDENIVQVSGDNILDLTKSVMGELTAGRLNIREAQALMNTIATKAKIIEIYDQGVQIEDLKQIVFANR